MYELNCFFFLGALLDKCMQLFLHVALYYLLLLNLLELLLGVISIYFIIYIFVFVVL